MGGRKWLVLALLAIAGPACAQDVDPNFDRLVRPWIEQLADCVKAQVPVVAKTTDPAETAAAAAVAACEDERQRVEHIYLRPPYNDTPAQAKAVVQQAVDGLMPMVMKDIKAARGA